MCKESCYPPVRTLNTHGFLHADQISSEIAQKCSQQSCARLLSRDSGLIKSSTLFDPDGFRNASIFLSPKKGDLLQYTSFAGVLLLCNIHSYPHFRISFDFPQASCQIGVVRLEHPRVVSPRHQFVPNPEQKKDRDAQVSGQEAAGRTSPWVEVEPFIKRRNVKKYKQIYEAYG